MRVLITGANGLIGTPLVRLCLARKYEVFSGYTGGPAPVGTPVPIDLTDDVSVSRAFEQSKPEVVFHLAAMVNVDRCEVEKKLASRINEDGTRSVAYLAKRHGAKVIAISSDYVFSGDKGMYTEDDTPLPVNHFGFTKLMAEEAVLESGAEHVIARPSVVYSPLPFPGETNFALWLYGILKSGQEVRLCRDQHVSPTIVSSLASMLLEACETGLRGIYHMSGATRVSRYEFGLRLAEAFGFDKGLIRPGVMEDFHGKWVARRPPDSSLDTSKAAAALANKPIGLGESLAMLKQKIEAREG